MIKLERNKNIMPNIQFEEDFNNFRPRGNSGNNQSSDAPKGILGLILKTGIVKNEQQANILMVIVTIIIVGINIYLLNS